MCWAAELLEHETLDEFQLREILGEAGTWDSDPSCFVAILLPRWPVNRS